MTDFLNGWRIRLESGETGLKLASGDHPLEVFVGANDAGNPKVAIQTTTKPKEPRLSRLVLVDRREGAGGYWQLTMTLQDRRFTEVFLRLVDDVWSRSAGSSNETQALAIVDDVLSEWRRLLKSRPVGVLTKEQLRGMVGEVWLLLNRFATDKPIDQALAGWRGPLNEHQDFVYPDSGLHEVKSVGPTMSAFKVASEYQLDPIEGSLELVVVAMADVPETDTGAVSLASLIARLKGLLDDSAIDDGELELRLAHQGVDITHPYYADNWFRITSVSTYQVPQEFPAIRASALSEGVNRVNYRVELAAIEKFKTAYQQVD